MVVQTDTIPFSMWAAVANIQATFGLRSDAAKISLLTIHLPGLEVTINVTIQAWCAWFTTQVCWLEMAVMAAAGLSQWWRCLSCCTFAMQRCLYLQTAVQFAHSQSLTCCSRTVWTVNTSLMAVASGCTEGPRYMLL